jgi:hypothetical protein
MMPAPGFAILSRSKYKRTAGILPALADRMSALPCDLLILILSHPVQQAKPPIALQKGSRGNNF